MLPATLWTSFHSWMLNLSPRDMNLVPCSFLLALLAQWSRVSLQARFPIPSFCRDPMPFLAVNCLASCVHVAISGWLLLDLDASSIYSRIKLGTYLPIQPSFSLSRHCFFEIWLSAAAFSVNSCGPVPDGHQESIQWLWIMDSSIIYSRKLCFQLLSETIIYFCYKSWDLAHS